MEPGVKIHLLILTADPARRERLERIFCSDADLSVLHPDEPHLFPAQVVVVDLIQPEAAQPSFWVRLHRTCPSARIMAIVEPTMDEAALLAALQAGTFSFVAWADAAAAFCRIAKQTAEGRFRAAPGWVEQAAQMMLAPPGPAAPDALRLGKLRLDMSRRQVHLNGRSLALSPLEFNTLAYLAQNAGRVVTPDELLHEVWQCGAQTGGTKNQVACCIKRLRHHLGSDGSAYLVTVRGQGYRLPTDPA